VAIKVIVELQGQPGRRDELVCLLESWSQPKDRASMVSWAAPGMPCSGTLTRSYEIADWESAEARQAHLQEAAATGA
jgi:hypothetical protein